MTLLALYDPDGSPLLSGAAARLSGTEQAEARDAYARVAEAMLGFTAPAFTDSTDVQSAKDAVAIQVSHMIAAGTEIFIAKSESRGSRSIVYRDDVIVNPMASFLANKVNRKNGRRVGYDPSQFATVRSLRPTTAVPDGYDCLKDIYIRSCPIP